MDFGYTEQQEAIRKLVREFAEKEVAPGAEERDATKEWDYALYKRLGDLGITSAFFPEEFGGSNADFLSLCLIIEELWKVDASLGTGTMVSMVSMLQLAMESNDEQKDAWKDKYILPVVRAEAMFSNAMTEPGGGSDTAALQTTAVLDNGEWVINGSKAFITNAGLENSVGALVVCLTNREKRETNFIFVPKGTPGYTVMPKYRKMGVRSQDCCELAFDSCRVPALNLIGEQGTGRERFVGYIQNQGRVYGASAGLGVGKACYEASLEYAARQRKAFGRPISKFQYVQGMLVEMALDLEMGELIRNKAALSVENAWPEQRRLCSMAKWFCTEAGKRMTDYAVQIFGGIGYMDECPVSRYYRDARFITIGDGTTEIQKSIIAHEIGC